MDNREFNRIVNLMNDIQIAALGEVTPQDDFNEYIADINERITEMEKAYLR